jgi:N-acetylneuraminate synthase
MKRRCEADEIKYLDALVRGVYAKRDLKQGHAVQEGDVYLAIPLQKGQMSCRELMTGQILLRDVAADQALMIDQVDSPYAYDEDLKRAIYERGI